MVAQPANTNPEPSRGENAKRFGKLGLLVGAIVGLTQGGGIMGALQMGMMGAGVAAAGGAVAGNKLNPMLDKVMGMIPGFNKGQSKEKQADSGVSQEVSFEPQREPQRRDVNVSVSRENARAVDSIDPALLASARENAGESLRSAGEGMDPKAVPVTARGAQEWVSPDAAHKRPTHDASPVRH